MCAHAAGSAPDDLTILEVVKSVESSGRIRTCPLGLAAHGVRLCPLHLRLEDALAQVQQAFSSKTLAELLAEASGRAPLCLFLREAKRKAIKVGLKWSAAMADNI
jgi:Rrf2 family transcriptional regulator, nitric oxide-sensitive transcriptional repressor